MTTSKDLPEEATEEPKIRTTEEEADRAARRDDVGEGVLTAKQGRRLADPDSPLRIPGELSSRPEEDDDEDS
jgi:hypothetical protein